MNSAPHVLLVVPQDGLLNEARFLRTCLEEIGVEVCHLDPALHGAANGTEIAPGDIAAVVGLSMDDIRHLQPESKGQETMLEGSAKRALQIHRKHHFSAILAIGDTFGNGVAANIVNDFPDVATRLLISPRSAHVPAPGSEDSGQLVTPCNVYGLNALTRKLFRETVATLATMIKAQPAAHPKAAAAASPGGKKPRPLVMISTLDATDPCCHQVRSALEARDIEVMVFISNGEGGRTLDALVDEIPVTVVLELSLLEVTDFLNDGLCSAGAQRGRAALNKGIPTIFVPGNADFIMAGPLDSAQRKYPGKRYHQFNADLTAVATEVPELEQLAEHLAEVLGSARGRVSCFVPLQGLSAHDDASKAPSNSPALGACLKKVLPKHVNLVKLDQHIHAEGFADALTVKVLDYITASDRDSTASSSAAVHL